MSIFCLFAISGDEQGGLGITGCQCVESFSCPANPYTTFQLLNPIHLGIHVSAPQQSNTGSRPLLSFSSKALEKSLNEEKRQEERVWRNVGGSLNGSRGILFAVLSFHPLLGVRGNTKRLLCSTGDQTWLLNVNLRSDKASESWRTC